MNSLLNTLEKIEKKRLQVDRHRVIKMVAISKYTDKESIKELYSCGQRAFGESKVQDLAEKNEELKELPIEWHFIGRLQTNKINHLLKVKPTLIHSIDSLTLAYELDKRASDVKGGIDVLLQVNSAYEESKAGFLPEALQEGYLEIKSECKNLNLKGLMSIGAHSEDSAVIEKSFKITHNLFETLQKDGATILSMGMSGDWDIALENGSNMLRLGSILFS